MILSALLALVSLAAGVPEAQLKGAVPDRLIEKGLGSGPVRFIGIAEAAAAVGLVVGIWWQPLGIAAATGMAVLFIGAVAFPAEKGEYGDGATRNAATVPVLLLLVAAATVVTPAASL
ncbi:MULTISPECIES: DoxX family protein [unclassified Streptomyces]|uniref:DoxX family protein n=1 Tax=unclassified Streptomyces TaxID=2593676 RepID=UPI0037FD23A6